MKRLSPAIQRMLPCQGQRAIVGRAYVASGAVINQHPSKGRRSFGTLGHEDRLHPGKGSA